jgi:hypothetical protein
MPCSVKTLAGLAPRHFTTSSSNGVLPVCSPKFGSEVWNTTNYMGSLGLGKRQIVLASKQRWPESPTVQTRRIGKKRDKTRHILIEEIGVLISLLSRAANRHDTIALEPLLKADVVSPTPAAKRNLCLDACYVDKEEDAQCNGFFTHIRPRVTEKREGDQPQVKGAKLGRRNDSLLVQSSSKFVTLYKNRSSLSSLDKLVAVRITLNKVVSIYE